VTRVAARVAGAAIAAALAILAPACGDEEDPRSPQIVPGRTLTIYTSLPQQGATRRAAVDTLRAQRLALEQVRGRAGRFRVRLVAVDGASGRRDAGTPTGRR
jgi:branched-chain amino acid transport system substrate-binding protein